MRISDKQSNGAKRMDRAFQDVSHCAPADYQEMPALLIGGTDHPQANR